jgi:hypothetical protein
MKKIIYVTLFTFLGLLLATLIHVAIEYPLLTIITNNFEYWQNTFLWQHWPTLHRFAGGAIWIGGAVFGYLMGQRYWRIIYVEKLRKS